MFKTQNQKWVGLAIAELLTMVEEKVILVVVDRRVIYGLTLKGYYDQDLKQPNVFPLFQ